ncbi:MFS transporter [Streptacidiphilus sp. NEAU-YB345]|uniref:MFS transporter n=2 Tax=Streptacidiphilus fuscans TaxID=2789292 RepID=A0A931B8P3_9ACTN|nr:MFS transporter [Streptacidiphilus fuscans]MBF9072987.1 MFS transporter [Streptacidiphilus fuscans]
MGSVADVVTGRTRRAVASVHRFTSAAALRTGDFTKATGRRIRRATSAEGAGESGLAKLIELHAVNSAGDMMITVALASTIFFSVPTHEARGRVALYLLITMAPFVLLAPVIGPMLDRIPSGRRAAMAVSLLVRAGLAWMMTGAIAGASLQIYPLALGVLVASKAYGVVRSVVVPRLRPPQLPLVKANSRVSLAGLLATGLAGAVGALLHLIGPDWPLRAALIVYIVGAGLAFSLPHQVDLDKGEERALLHSHDPSAEAGAGPGPEEVAEPGDEVSAEKKHKVGLRSVGPGVVLALGAEGTLRCLFGFLTFFLAFLVREHPLAGLPATVSLGLVAAALGIGNTLGTVMGAWLRTRRPETIVTLMLALALVASLAGAVFYGAFTVVMLAFVSGLTQCLGKVGLDALIQRDVPETVRTSAFARSETLMQLTWVLGGGLGIVLPLVGEVGMITASVLVGVSFVWALRTRATLGPRNTSPAPDVA